MRLISTSLFCLFFCLVCTNGLGQTSADQLKVLFQSGTVVFPENVKDLKTISFDEKEVIEGRYYRYVQFYQLPTPLQKRQMKDGGLELLDYIPHHTFLTAIKLDADVSLLGKMGVRSIVAPNPVEKLARRLVDQSLPEWAVNGNSIDLEVHYQRDLTPEVIIEKLQAKGVEILETLPGSASLFIRIDLGDMANILTFPYLSFVEPVPPPAVPEDIPGTTLHRSNTINSEHPMGRHYDGAGVNVLVRDDGAVGPHIDFTGRLSLFTNDPTGTHGDNVASAFGGAGNLNPFAKGNASGAQIYVINYQGSFTDNTIFLHQNEDVMITNSSYGDGCNSGYTSRSQRVDEQVYDNPSLIHIFSCGNSGSTDCGYGAGAQWGNITGGHKMGKNVMAVANLLSTGFLSNSSSRGPATDGRIKPDISAHGTSKYMTFPNNSYGSASGTSFAAPSVGGVLAQLYQAYKEFNGGNNPESGLIKAITLNTANDLGNPGPDFRYGWGHINAFRAVKIIEQGHYFVDTITNGQTQTHTLAVPAGTEQLRVMVYWTDREGALLASRALVNDLDFTLSDAGGTNHLPWILNPAPNPTTLNAPAVPGIDTLNNMEQITLDVPAAGNVTLNITGTSVPMGPQQYFVVYEFVQDEIAVTYPSGGEGFRPSSSERIHWDAQGNTGTFDIDYSTDNGANWCRIVSALPSNTRMYNWGIPRVLTGQAKIRVTRNGVSGMSELPFSIIGQVSNLEILQVCGTTTQLIWDPVPGATGYDVLMLGSKYMDSIGHTSSNYFEIQGTASNEVNWYSVQSTGPGGAKSRRVFAISSPGTLVNCSEQNDIAVLDVFSSEGTELVTCYPDPLEIEIRLFNQGLVAQSQFPIGYQMANGFSFQEMYMDTLEPGEIATHVFSTPLPATFPGGNDNLEVFSSLPTDADSTNDKKTVSVLIRDGFAIPEAEEDFEGGLFPPTNWQVVNPNFDATWLPRTVTGSNGASTVAAFMNNFGAAIFNGEDGLRTLSLDISSSVHPILTFDVAYAADSTGIDQLRIDVSRDCGRTFDTTIYLKEGANLQTVGDQPGAWFPTAASDWRQDTVDLSSLIGDEVILQFTSVTRRGNNLFIDNINLVETMGIAATADFGIDAEKACVNQSITVTDFSTGSNIAYTWNFGADAIPATSSLPGPHEVAYSTTGTKIIQLTINNSLGTKLKLETIKIVDGEPKADFSVTQSGGNFQTYQFTPDTLISDVTYSWDFGDGTTSVLESPSHTFTQNAAYTVQLITTHPCGADTFTQEIDITNVSISDDWANGDIQVFPNPNSGKFEVQLADVPTGNYQINLLDLRGKRINQTQVSHTGKISNHPLDVSFLPKGVYLLNIQFGGLSHTLRLLLK